MSGIMNLQYDNFTAQDIDIVRWQLDSGTVPVCSVAERCGFGFPRIIILSPRPQEGRKDDYNYEALSNVIWLTCPYLNDRIHEFEDRGFIGRVASFMNSLPAVRGHMEAAHSHFYYFRKRFYRDFFGDIYPEDLIGVFNSGVGGVRDGSSLKCLHANFAHYRLDDTNVAGYIMQKLLHDKIDCNNRACDDAHKGR